MGDIYSILRAPQFTKTTSTIGRQLLLQTACSLMTASASTGAFCPSYQTLDHGHPDLDPPPCRLYRDQKVAAERNFSVLHFYTAKQGKTRQGRGGCRCLPRAGRRPLPTLHVDQCGHCEMIWMHGCALHAKVSAPSQTYSMSTTCATNQILTPLLSTVDGWG